MGTIRAAAVIAAVAIVCTAPPAGGHEAEAGTRPRLHSVDPALPGVQIEVRSVLAPTVVVRNETATPVEVIGADGRPFLRIGSSGIDANLASPDFYRSETPAAAASTPGSATAGAPPRFVRISDGPTWAWFEHRIDPARPDWEVPLAVNGRTVTVRGGWETVESRGRFSLEIERIEPAVPGLEVEPLQGSVPGLFVRNATGRVVHVPGPRGEPFLRVGPHEVRRADGTGGWRRVATGGRFGWTEPRVGWPAAEDLPEHLHLAASVTTARSWSLDLRVGAQPVTVSGRLLWIPVAGHHRGAGYSGVPPWAVAAAGVVVAAGAGAGLWRRRRTAP